MVNDEGRTEQPTISPDSSPSRWDRIRAEQWFGWLIRALIAVVIILIIVFGGRWLHHRLSHKSTPTTTTSRPAFNDNSKKQSAKSGTNSGSNSSSKKSGGAGSGAGNPSLKNGQQLANTGPGDVVLIFIGASLLFGGLHYAYEIRKNS